MPTGIRVGAALTATLSTGACTNSGDLMNLAFTYGATTTNNGNVTSQVITRRSQDLTGPLTQSYAYVDPANRLTQFGESSTLPPQTYAYDAFGNRALTAGSLNGDNSLTPQALGYNRYNRWPSFAYDAAGNITNDGGNSSIHYDAESRVTQATNAGSAVIGFVYDGEGRRVQKTVGSTTTTYVYDAAGKIAAEYSTVAPVVTGTEYLSDDHLGSTRLTTDSSGNPLECHDYLPFGEEISSVLTPIRAGCYLGADGVTHKFTGKERDTETSLDYFGARYFSGAQSRFTTPDWSDRPQPIPYANLNDPQSLNLYTYESRDTQSPISNVR